MAASHTYEPRASNLFEGHAVSQIIIGVLI